ncbi:MAG: ROK family protein [Oscillibacter sp.]|nr:ROK family protein [Oscillibacter sp.]
MYYIGIDVGGTNLKAGLVDEAGNIVEVERIPLEYKDPEQFAEVVAGLAKAVSAKGGVALEEIAWVGMGMPGSVDGGNVRYLTNIPMENVPLEELFRKHFDRPLYLGNDADCAAVGEYFSGVGKGTRDFAVVTLGTGVGCGLILGGHLQGGAASSEAGHLVIVHGGEQCNCGRKGCWERYASATALIGFTRKAMAEHPESGLHAVAEKNGAVDGRTSFEAAKAGDETALAVCRQYVEYLACGLNSLINILRPEMVALGGGVAAAPEELLLKPVQELVEKESFSSHGGRVTQVLRAQLGNDAGIIGAALLGRVV